MRIAALQRSFRVKKLHPCPMEILKRVDRPTMQVSGKLNFSALMSVKVALIGR